MFRNYLKTSWRNLTRDKSYTLINIFGLAIGVAACLMITLYILDELSYDKFHERSDRIYRVYVDSHFGNNRFRSVLTPNPMKEALLSDFSQVESVTQFFKQDQVNVKYEDKRFVEDDVYFACEDFFGVFDFHLVRGNAEDALAQPNQIVLTESMARKYFGDNDPVGKPIVLYDDQVFQVTGVCRDVPHNAHFHFQFLASYSSTEKSKDPIWVNNGVYTYMVLHEHMDPDRLEADLDLMVEKYVGPHVEDWMGIGVEAFEKQGNSYGFYMQPLEDIYLHSDFQDELEPVSDVSRIWYFSIIALFILVIACINFMNLATAKYANRAKEVGIRKVVGSRRRHLIPQFLTESVLVAFFAVLISIMLVEIFLPLFNHLSLKELNVAYLSSWYVLPALLLLVVFVGLMAGLYPAFFLSSFRPIRILKKDLSSGVKGRRLRDILVVSQFAITIALFISTAIVYQQNHYMTSKKLGFDMERVVVIDQAHYLRNTLEDFGEALKQSPHISSVSVSGSLPGRSSYGGTSLQVEGRSLEDMVFFSTAYVREGYLETLGLRLLQGRFFSRDFGTNAESLLINQRAADELGFENPVGKQLMQGEDHYTIIGVVANHHFESLHKPIRPLAFFYYNKGSYRYLPVRIQMTNPRETIQYIQSTWNDFTNHQPFSYFFLDRDFLKLYDAEMRTARIFTLFSILAILIACLGLLGLSAFMAEKRNKEIGIRKSVGAGTASILKILYKEVFVLLVLSTLLAWPLTWYLMSRWLENFAFRIDLGLLPFLISSIVALLIAIFTTSFQALKAAHINPAYILRDE
jgi:putative ABC transport system permease protein